jgi:hypothetical protein
MNRVTSTITIIAITSLLSFAADGKGPGRSALVTEKPDENRDRYQDVQFIGDLEMICQRCHVIRGNHAGNVNHLVKPSTKALARMQAMEQKFGIILTLDKNGRLTCITCHNPHDIRCHPG